MISDVSVQNRTGTPYSTQVLGEAESRLESAGKFCQTPHPARLGILGILGRLTSRAISSQLLISSTARRLLAVSRRLAVLPSRRLTITSYPSHMTNPLNVVLISTYEMGRQPFGLASPAAWLRQAGSKVTCLDLAMERLDPDVIGSADLIAFHLPMHTATRLAASFVERIRASEPHGASLLLRPLRPGQRGLLARPGGRDDPGRRVRGRSGRPGAAPGGRAQWQPCRGSTTRAAHFPEQAAVRRAGPRWPAPPPSLRARHHARWLRPRDGLHRGQPGLQEPLPPLPDRAGLRRALLRRAAGGGAGGHRATGGGWGAAHHLWRSRFLQRPHPRHAHRARAARAVSRTSPTT